MVKNNQEANKRNYQRHKVSIAKTQVRTKLLNGCYVKPETIEKYDMRKQEFTPEQLALIHPVVTLIDKQQIKLKDFTIPWETFELSPLTISRYQSSIKRLMKLLEVDNETILFITLKNCEKVLSILQPLDSYAHEFQTIISICNHSEKHMHYLENVFEIYHSQMMHKAYEKLQKMVEKKQIEFLYDDEIPLWDNVLEAYEKITENQPLSQAHLVLATMVLIPPLRDDWGHVLFINNSEDIIEVQNFYDLSRQILGLYNYKGSKVKGFTEVKISNRLADLLIASLEKDPRTYVFEKQGKPHGSLSHFISYYFTFGINDLRKSYTTYVIENCYISWPQKVTLIKASLHNCSCAIEEYYYPTENHVEEID